MGSGSEAESGRKSTNIKKAELPGWVLNLLMEKMGMEASSQGSGLSIWEDVGTMH